MYIKRDRRSSCVRQQIMLKSSWNDKLEWIYERAKIDAYMTKIRLHDHVILSCLCMWLATCSQSAMEEGKYFFFFANSSKFKLDHDVTIIQCKLLILNPTSADSMYRKGHAEERILFPKWHLRSERTLVLTFFLYAVSVFSFTYIIHVHSLI